MGEKWDIFDSDQVLQVAVEDNYLRNNVSDNVLRELKQSHNIDKTHKKALTIPEQKLFMDFLKPECSPFHHWYPMFAVMLLIFMVQSVENVVQ